MKCPECGSEKKITGMRTPFQPRGKVDYGLECQECGHHWRRGRGNRFLTDEARAASRAEWSNVEMGPSRIQQLLDAKK